MTTCTGCRNNESRIKQARAVNRVSVGLQVLFVAAAAHSHLVIQDDGRAGVLDGEHAMRFFAVASIASKQLANVAFLFSLSMRVDALAKIQCLTLMTDGTGLFDALR